MSLNHNSKLADKEPKWSELDKKLLPRIAFAGPGEVDKKTTWKYPHHWVDHPKLDSEKKHIIDGTMYLHKGGLRAAWAYANGARTGRKADKDVRDHLEKHLKDLGETKESLEFQDNLNISTLEFERNLVCKNESNITNRMLALCDGMISTKRLKKDLEAYGVENMRPTLNIFLESVGYPATENMDEVHQFINNVLTGGNEYLETAIDDSWKNLQLLIAKTVPLIFEKSKLLVATKNTVLSDITNIADGDFKNLKLFGQSKISLENTDKALADILVWIITVWDKIRRGENVSRDIKTMELKMANLGYTTTHIPTVKFGGQSKKLVYNPEFTAFEPLADTSLEIKGYDKHDVEEMVDYIIEEIYKVWTLRKSQWWVDLLQSPTPDMLETLRGSNLGIISADEGLLFLSMISIWLDGYLASLTQMIVLMNKMDNIR